MLRERKIPGDKLRRTDEIERRSRQRWHVQRLANVASGIWAFGVFVKETAARGKVQQRSASQQRQRAAHSRPFKQESKAIHRPDLP
jgi:hypothetical protein